MLAALMALGTAVPTVFASTSGAPHVFKSEITLDGKVLSQPYSTVHNDGYGNTTYMPMYYIDNALKKAGYTVSWNGSTWSLTSKASNLDFSNLAVGSGNTTITVNGKIVKKINSIAMRDPAGGKHAAVTTYIPIYYVQPLLEALGIKNTWNGKVWAGISPVTLAAGATYGPKIGTTQLYKDLVVTGTGVTVQNITVQGNIYINPGANGTVHLNNVKATGSIVVLSGASHSIYFDNVQAPTLQINSSSAVHIVTQGKTSIDTTVIPTAEQNEVLLEQQSGSLGNITAGSHSSVVLSGTVPFKSVVVTGTTQVQISSSTTVTILTISGSGVKLVVDQGGKLTSLSIGDKASGIVISNDGTISLLQNNSSSSSVSVSGTGEVTQTEGNAPSQGGSTGGSGGGGGGGGAPAGGGGGGGGAPSSGGSSSGSSSSSNPTTAQKDATLVKLVTELDAIHAQLLTDGNISAVRAAETAAQSADWTSILYGTNTPPSNASTLVSVVQQLVTLATYTQLSQDRSTTSGNVGAILTEIQSLDPSINITGNDLYNLFENFKADLLVEALQTSNSSVSFTSLVAQALQDAINNTTDGTTHPFVTLQSTYQVSDLAGILSRAQTAIDPTKAATNALIEAFGMANLQLNSLTSGTIAAGAILKLTFNSSAPSGLAGIPIPSSLVTWNSSASGVTITPGSSGSYPTISGSGTATITATVHGYTIFSQTVTVN